MHYLYLLFTLLISPLILHAEQTPTPIPQPVNNSTANPIVNNNIYHNNSYIITISTETITKYCTQWIQNNIGAITDQEDMKNCLQTFLWEKKYKIGAGILAGCYCSINYMLLSDYYFITKKDLWSQWKSDCSFEQLCALSQQELSKELLFAIGQHSFNHQNPTNAMHPFIGFVNELNNEIKCIERYINLAKTIKKYGLMRIFATNDNKIGHAEKLFERAHFIKHIFLSWFAAHNFNG